MGSHIPVLLAQAVDGLHVQAGQWYVDTTFGRGGHTQEILKNGGKVIAFDCDEEAIAFGEKTFATKIADKSLILVRSNFDQLELEIKKLTSEQQCDEISGVLFDFGVSSPQVDSETRGFSFQYDAPLDMRMDTRLGVQAKDLLAVLSEKQLADLFFQYGGEMHSRKIAKAIVSSRSTHTISTVQDLVKIIEHVKPRRGEHLHPATKVFQALRIAVNGELESIEQALPQALRIIKNTGRIVTISFHEGEDRIVKTYFKNWESQHQGIQITKKVLTPTEIEIAQNVRSRSAKLRIFEKNDYVKNND